MGGSINVSGGIFNLNPSTTGGIATWNVSGNVNVTGGTLTASGTNNTTINFVNSGTKTLTISGSGIIPSTSTILWNVGHKFNHRSRHQRSEWCGIVHPQSRRRSDHREFDRF